MPRGRSLLVVQEGDSVDLQCLVSGKPKPQVLWSRLGPREAERLKERLEERENWPEEGPQGAGQEEGQEDREKALLRDRPGDGEQNKADRLTEQALESGPLMESSEGVLHIANVTRDMSGLYRCQTSQFNGFNVKPRQALIQLQVQCEYFY